MANGHEEVREQLSAYLDGEMQPDERAAFEARLAETPELQREAEAWRRVDALYAGMAPVAAPGGLEDQVREAVKPAVIRFRRRHAAPQRLWPMLAAAAGIAIMLGLFVLQFDTSTPAVPGGTQLAKQSAPPIQKTPALVSEARSEAPALPKPETAAPKPELVAEEVYRLEMEAPEAPPAKVPPPPVEAAASPPASAPPLRDADEDETVEDRGIETKDKDAEKSSLQNVTVGGSLRVRGDYKEPQAYAQPAPAEEPAPPPPAMMASPARPVEALPSPAPSALPQPDLGLPGNDEAAPRAKAEAGRPAGLLRTLGFVGTTFGSSTNHRTVAGRQFVLDDGVWKESTYLDEDVQAVRRDGATYRRLLRKEPRLDEIAQLGGKVIVRVEGTWFLITGPASTNE